MIRNPRPIVLIALLLGAPACARDETPACGDLDAASRAATFYGYAQRDDDWVDFEVHAGVFDPPVEFDDAVTVTGAGILEISPHTGYLTMSLVPQTGAEEVIVTGVASCDYKGTPWVATVTLVEAGSYEVEVGPPE